MGIIIPAGYPAGMRTALAFFATLAAIVAFGLTIAWIAARLAA